MTYSDPAFSLANLIRAHADVRPSHIALSEGDRTVDFAELDSRSSQAGQAMMAEGVAPGDRVVIIARNSIAYYEAILAAAKIGAVLAGVNFRLTADEITSILHDANPDLILVGDEFAHLVHTRTKVVTLGDNYERWLSAFDCIDPNRSSPDDVVLQIYSSGTTGMPKGAMLTNANLSWTPPMGREVYLMNEHSVNLLTAPLFHVGGSVYSFTTLAQGGHIVLSPEFDAVTTLSLIERHHVTHVFFVPTVIRMLLDVLVDHPIDLSSLELVAYGAAPIDVATLTEAIDAFGCKFLGVYGMTETAGPVSALVPDDHLPEGSRSYLLRSVGKPFAWHDVGIFDPVTKGRVESGSIGEIWVHSPQNMAGYWHQPKLTLETLRPDGWMRTGDLGWQDEKGFLYVQDRLKDLIITGGENVYSGEVERVLVNHPDVNEVVVIGVPQPRWGETVKAVVVLRAGHTTDEAEVIEYCRKHLAHFKCPTSVDFVAELPRNAAGKVLKRVLRDAYR